MSKELTCNDCEHYDPWEGVCLIDGENHYGYEDACNDNFKQETDTQLTKEELQGDNNE